MGKTSSACNRRGRCLFRWEEVKGDDNAKFKNFLSRSFSSNWIKEADINIDSEIIKVSHKDKSLLLNLNKEKGEVNLKLSDGRTGKLIAENDKEKWKIYKEYAIGICDIKEDRICQGDIIKNIKYLENFDEAGDYYDVSVIYFPLVVVLSQDCDLDEDFLYRNGIPKEYKDDDKIMFSLLVAPIYNAEQVLVGNHLSRLRSPNAQPELNDEDAKMTMHDFRKNESQTDIESKFNHMKNNEVPRYHFLRFPESMDYAESFIDFKHYFSLNINYLIELKRENFVCRIDMPYREFISQRFSNYLSRIGLPEFPRSEKE